ncbi:MBL fold metallo-hydrolase [Clostridium uliginosum]|uniref:Glyoxylase, beta-lactamase superfamily II n=1 Tax=Clostridium uliginosum TaxID=119641 RepID=A0A1I1PQR1_9CLOT|nr:MBL fold metallo-hydrolase [Clostridium uliginosum]SFD12052.1 Glyoxylase, beta-lactamase superfamily II [Clostridium uliginosum]
MIIKTIPAGIYDANCYLVIDEGSKECGVIDPGGDSQRIETIIKSLDVKVKYIILTHGHVDHVGGVVDLSKTFNVPFFISKIDEEYMEKDYEVFGSLPKASGYLKEGDTLSLGDKEIKVIETPGHTKGGLCFLIEDKVFTGDTLFQGSIGRTDFVGGNMGEIINSIKEKLLILGDDVEVYPGHGSMSNILYEKRRNPFLA